jgi:hypothetical protein
MLLVHQTVQAIWHTHMLEWVAFALLRFRAWWHADIGPYMHACKLGAISHAGIHYWVKVQFGCHFACWHAKGWACDWVKLHARNLGANLACRHARFGKTAGMQFGAISHAGMRDWV